MNNFQQSQISLENIGKIIKQDLADKTHAQIFENLKNNPNNDTFREEYGMHISHMVWQRIKELLTQETKSSLLHTLSILKEEVFHKMLDKFLEEIKCDENINLSAYNFTVPYSCQLILQHYRITIQQKMKEDNRAPFLLGGTGTQEEIKYKYKGGFPNIISPDSIILTMIEDQFTQGTLKEKSFLDIGCGIPVISQTMKDIWYREAAGLEYNAMLVEKSKPHFPDVEIYHDDILKFTEYDKYDILYAYNPLSNDNLMTRALCHIIKNMKIGAILYFYNARLEKKNLIKSWFEEMENMFEENKNGSLFKYTKTCTELPKEFQI